MRIQMFYSALKGDSRNATCPTLTRRASFFARAKAKRARVAVWEREREGGCASSCIALPFPVWVQHPRRCAHPTLSRAVVSSWVGWDTNSNSNNNKWRYTEESESVTTIAKRPRESSSWYWRRYKNEHAQTRTHSEHDTQRQPFRVVVSFIVGAKFNLYDLYMNFDIDYFAFQHLQLKTSISCAFSHKHTCTFAHI